MTSKKKSLKIALTVFILLIGLASNFPFLFMISSSFKVSGEVMKFPWHLIPENPTLMNFQALLTNGIYNFQKWYLNTVVMTALTIVIKIFFL